MIGPRAAQAIYRALLRLLPRDFRADYAEPMYETFVDRLDDPRHRHTLLAFMRTLWDFGFTGAIEWGRVLSRGHRPSTLDLPKASMFDSFSDDVRFALRLLRKHRVFTVVAVVVLALGTGAVSTIFSVANAIVLRPLPAVGHPESLSWIARSESKGEGTLSASYPYYESLATRSRTMSSIAAWTMVPLTVSTGEAGVSLLGNMVSGNFFHTLDVQPFLGRFFSGDEARVEGAYPVAVVSHGYWQSALGGDSSAVGRDISINGRRYAVIGVAPPKFAALYPILRTDVWVPIAMHAHLRPNVGSMRSANAAYLELFGRLAPGYTRESASPELSALTAQFAASKVEPAAFAYKTGVRLAPVTGLPSDATGPVLGFFVILLVVASLVLMIASVNVASMMLARSIARRREIAVRLAIGASPRRILRQLLTEAVLLFSVGGVAGVGVAVLGTRLAQRIELPVDMPMQIDVAPDARVIAFTIAVSMLTGIVFGLAPAVQSLRLDINNTLRGGGAGAGRHRSRLRNGLVVGQVAMSLLLLTAAGLFVRSLQKGREVDLGFGLEGVSTAAIDVSTAGYDETRARVFYEQLLERLRRQPGIEAIGVARLLPLSGNSAGRTISSPEAAPPGGHIGDEMAVAFNQVDAGYFDAIRLPVVRGRPFNGTDAAGAPGTAIVNETLAHQLFGDRSALGKVIALDERSATIVGVARDAKFKDLTDRSEPLVYLPREQWWTSAVNVIVRGGATSTQAADAIRREVRALDGALPVPVVTTLRQATAIVLLPQRAAAAVTAVLGVIGLVLAAVGLYGVIAFSAAQRAHEMGVRLALGAQPRDVRGLVIGEGMRLVGVGVILGLVLAAVSARALMPFLFGLAPIDLQTFAMSTVVLLATAWLASYLPARRAAAMDPMASLRRE